MTNLFILSRFKKMNVFICTTILFFCFESSHLKIWKNKASLSLGVCENNISGPQCKSHSFNLDDLKSLVKFVRNSNLDRRNPTNSSERKRTQGKSKGTNEVVIPLVLVFKIMGVLLSLLVVKTLFFKGVLAAKIALITFGVIFARKLRRFGTLMLLKNHEFYFEKPPGQYPTNEPDLSGYGYEYNFIPGFQTPEQKYNIIHRERRKRHKT